MRYIIENIIETLKEILIFIPLGIRWIHILLYNRPEYENRLCLENYRINIIFYNQVQLQL